MLYNWQNDPDTMGANASQRVLSRVILFQIHACLSGLTETIALMTNAMETSFFKVDLGYRLHSGTRIRW